jgi:copper oxidase (laccase) domain-containing protein
VKILLQAGPVLVVLGEATHRDLRFDARNELDLQALAEDSGWTGSVRVAEQVHGVRILSAGDDGCGDAFLLGQDEAAAVRIADCWPVVVADPSRARAVVAHCGWRGAAGGLAGASVRRLLQEGSRPDDLVACIGPGIQVASFEVGPEVAAAFPESVHGSTAWGTPSVDLERFLAAQLNAAGVPDSAIVRDHRDSFLDPDLHSHRRDAAHAGRMACLCIVRKVGTISLEDRFHPKEHP